MDTTAVEVEGLRKRFGDVRALDGVNLTVPKGTVIGLLGPNGAGKTTLVRVLATLLDADSGRASVLGFDVATQPFSVRRGIGLAGQFAAVDELQTGHENLVMVGRLYGLSRGDARARATEVLRRFDLAVMAERELAATLRKPTLVLIAVIQPVLLVLLFRYVFGGAIKTPGSSYVDFLMPGILVLTAISGRSSPAWACRRTCRRASSTGSGRCPSPGPRCWSGARCPTWRAPWHRWRWCWASACSSASVPTSRWHGWWPHWPWSSASRTCSPGSRPRLGCVCPTPRRSSRPASRGCSR